MLSAALCASALTWLVFRATALLPRRARIRALLGTAETLVDLAVPVDPERDHIRGPAEAPVTLVEYGDFECPYCGQAEPVVRELLADFGDVRYVWRHLPLTDVHPNAAARRRGVRGGGRAGRVLGDARPAARPPGRAAAARPAAYAEQLGLDVERFATTCAGTPTCRGSTKTSTRPTSAASPARRPSSSTSADTTAPTTSTRSPPPSGPPVHARS